MVQGGDKTIRQLGDRNGWPLRAGSTLLLSSAPAWPFCLWRCFVPGGDKTIRQLGDKLGPSLRGRRENPASCLSGRGDAWRRQEKEQKLFVFGGMAATHTLV